MFNGFQKVYVLHFGSTYRANSVNNANQAALTRSPTQTPFETLAAVASMHLKSHINAVCPS